MPIDATEFLETPHGRLAYRQTPGRLGKAPMVWLSGLRSDMMGGKASLLHAAALAEDRPYLRFDYRGHGESDVEFKDTVVSDWREDALRMIDERTEGPLLLVGVVHGRLRRAAVGLGATGTGEGPDAHRAGAGLHRQASLAANAARSAKGNHGDRFLDAAV